MRTMTRQHIQRHLQDIFATMPTDKLTLLMDFAEYLKSKEEWDATQELMNDAGMSKDTLEGREQAQRGESRTWRDIKSYVRD